MLRLAVLASGQGSNMHAIQQKISQGSIRATIALALTNKPEAPVTALAKEAGIPLWARSHTDFSERESFDLAMLEAMDNAGIDAVVLAGYMRLLSPAFIRAYQGKILNVHPSLLPAFAGAHGIQDTLAYGARFAGCTVHFVTEEMDAGPIIIQAALPIGEGEDEASLRGRIQRLEHKIYPQAVQWFAQGRLRIDGRHVALLPAVQELHPTPDAPSVPDEAEIRCNVETVLVSPPLEKGF